MDASSAAGARIGGACLPRLPWRRARRMGGWPNASLCSPILASSRGNVNSLLREKVEIIRAGDSIQFRATILLGRQVGLEELLMLLGQLLLLLHAEARDGPEIENRKRQNRHQDQQHRHQIKREETHRLPCGFVIDLRHVVRRQPQRIVVQKHRAEENARQDHQNRRAEEASPALLAQETALLRRNRRMLRRKLAHRLPLAPNEIACDDEQRRRDEDAENRADGVQGVISGSKFAKPQASIEHSPLAISSAASRRSRRRRLARSWRPSNSRARR